MDIMDIIISHGIHHF